MPSPSHVDQVGGTHYQGEYQHWDLVVDNNITYLESCASKYVSRWQDKNGVEDLLKAISYLSKLKKSFSSRSFVVDPLKVTRWFEAVNVEPAEQQICWLIFCWRNHGDIDKAIIMIRDLITSQETGYVNQDR